MAAGRKPKSTVLHVLQGTFNATRHGPRLKAEPVPAGTLDEPPEWMSSEQREIWHRGLREAAAGQIKSIDASVFTVWVVAVDTHRQAAEQLAKLGAKGLLTRAGVRRSKPDANGKSTMEGGTVMQSPLVNVMNRQALLIVRAAAELGFSPTSRPRLATDGGASRNPFADL